MNKPRTSTRQIQAKISQKGLAQISDFFNQNPLTTLCELLQNARRANATHVEISAIQSGPDVRITLTDNGSGIKNEETLMHLWESGWDEQKKTVENPAGFGFFSLSHLPKGVTVRSKDWEMHIGKHVFSGEGGAISKPTGKFLTGTELTFHLPNTDLRTVDCHIAEACRFYPVAVRYNKTNLESKDFLEGAAHIITYEGLRIGIFHQNQTYKETNINFHGVVLHQEIPCPHPDWSVRIDVLDARMLDLVKPTRNHVILNEKWNDNLALARKATYEAAAHAGSHSLPFTAWQEAKALGIKIKEATPALKLAKPSKTHDVWWDHVPLPNYNTDCNNPPKPHKASIISRLDNTDLIALHLCGKPIPLLFEPDTTMEGYSWYPTQEATNLIQKIRIGKRWTSTPTEGGDTWKKIAKHLEKNNTADQVQLELTVTRQRDAATTQTFETYIAFNTEESGEDALGSYWITTKEGLESICYTVLNTLFFYHSTDVESDSYETQESYFEEAAHLEIIKRSSGAEAGHLHTIQTRIDHWDVQTAMRQLGVKQFTVVLKDGELEVVLPKKKATKP